MTPCYKCNGYNPDSDWTSMCAACRYALTNSKTFLDRLTSADLDLLRDMRIAVESDMRKAVGQNKR